ncbi:family 20 glycosylhydrolase [Neisseria sp.]|uniref:family 20 glycosylhydrolase n=1 Tax=Neisseria sp. TaxID=192066 RepID=UPI0035A04A49
MLGVNLKRWLWMLLALALASCQLSACTSYLIADRKDSGLMLDMARYFYTPEAVKGFIDTVAAEGGTFVHLHFSDNENYALESRLLGQKAADAQRRSDGVYVNKTTGKPFWSDGQLREVVNHARSKKIELVPEIGSPGHMGGIFHLMENAYGKETVKQMQTANGELDISKPKNTDFMQALIAETADKFGTVSRHFHIGGDEFGYDTESNRNFVAYANRQAEFLARRGLETRIWNDGIIKPTMDALNRDIEITYWSYDGDPQDKAEAAKRRTVRATLPDLLDHGFKVLNYNSYYLYVVPRDGKNWQADSAYAASDARKNWHLGVWDGNNHRNALTDGRERKISGAAVAVWGEHAGTLSNGQMQEYARGLLSTVLAKTNGRE